MTRHHQERKQSLCSVSCDKKSTLFSQMILQQVSFLSSSQQSADERNATQESETAVDTIPAKSERHNELPVTPDGNVRQVRPNESDLNRTSLEEVSEYGSQNDLKREIESVDSLGGVKSIMAKDRQVESELETKQATDIRLESGLRSSEPLISAAQMDSDSRVEPCLSVLQNDLYELRSVVVHLGSVFSGHFVTYRFVSMFKMVLLLYNGMHIWVHVHNMAIAPGIVFCSGQLVCR